MNEPLTRLAKALADALFSPNELDRNMEPANVVDGLFAIARALNRVATAIDNVRTDHPLQGETFDGISEGLGHIAEAIDDLTKRAKP
jgi:hypothetical protein